MFRKPILCNTCVSWSIWTIFGFRWRSLTLKTCGTTLNLCRSLSTNVAGWNLAFCRIHCQWLIQSSFTFKHSLKVGQLSEYLAKQLGYSYTTQRKLYLAGLVHDIGKLQTPNEAFFISRICWPKRYCCIKRHATDTRFALQKFVYFSSGLPVGIQSSWKIRWLRLSDGQNGEELDQPNSDRRFVVDVFQALSRVTSVSCWYDVRTDVWFLGEPCWKL